MAQAEKNKPKNKLKMLHLAQVMLERTDAEHGLTAAQIIEELALRGVGVERKTLYVDLEALREFGLDVRKLGHCAPPRYAVVERDFQAQELLLLADAVQSCRFLTEEASAGLVARIAKLGSSYAAESLMKSLHVQGRVKSQKDSVFGNLDVIQRAIDAGRKVSFRYSKFDDSNRPVLCHGGSRYVETPVHLFYSEAEYYLVAWHDEADAAKCKFKHFRVDRMSDIELSEEPATSNAQTAGFDAAAYQRGFFDMYGGEAVQATLLVEGRAMSVIADRFGEDVSFRPDGQGRCRVSVCVSATPTFFGWLAVLGREARIEAPKSLRVAYANYLRGILGQYEGE